MISKIKAALASLSAVIVFGVPAVAPVAVLAQEDVIRGGLCGGVELQTASGACVEASEDSFNNIIKTVINLLSIIVGIVAVIMIIWGGFKYITSGGDTTKVSSAKTTILYAIIGLIIVALAQLIVRFVLTKVNPV